MNGTARPVWHARGPRFLLLLACGWIGARAVLLWSVPGMPNAAVAPGATTARAIIAAPQPVAAGPATLRVSADVNRMFLRPRADDALMPTAGARTAAPPVPDRIGLDGPARAVAVVTVPPRASFAAIALPPLPPAALVPLTAAPPIAAPQPERYGQSHGRWSLSAYAMIRPAGAFAPGIAANRPAALGGTQAGVRADYVIDAARRARLYVRATASPVDRGDADLAAGASVRPFAAVPFDIHVERRIALAGAATGRTLVFLAGGVDARPIGHGLSLSAYAQGGIAGPGRDLDAEGFADGALDIQRPILGRGGMRLSVGAMIGGAAQRGASRIDVGPRASLDLPVLGRGARLTLDWRERVAGNARPGSGPALTLAAGF